MLPRRDHLAEVSNLFRTREDIFRAGGAEANRLGELEASLAANLEEIASLLSATAPVVAHAVAEAGSSEAGGGVPGVKPFGAHPYVERRGSGELAEES